MGDPMIYVGEKAAFPGWWDNVVIKNSQLLLLCGPACASSLLSCKAFYIIYFLVVFHT